MNLRSFSPLQIALGASVAVHAVLLTVRFVDPESFNRVFQDTPLEVILVNARTNEKPEKDKAKAIAQASMAGGGDAEKGRATTPLPPAETRRWINAGLRSTSVTGWKNREKPKRPCVDTW